MAGSLLGGIFGSSAAKAAGKTIAAAGQANGKAIDKATGQAIDAGYAGMSQANSAIDTGVSGANSAIDTGVSGAHSAIGTGLSDANSALKGVYDTEMGNLNPFLTAGQQGIGQLAELAGKGFAFNPSDLQNDPGYQFQLQQGLKGVANSMAGRGLGTSGAAAKAMANYSQGLAGTSYQNAFNRALNSYQTNIGALSTLAGFGQNANSQAITAGNNYGNMTSGNNMTAAGMNSNVDMSGAQLHSGVDMSGAGMKSGVAMQGNQYVGNVGLAGAQAAGDMYMRGAEGYAAGQMGAGNAWSNAIGGMTNSAMGMFKPSLGGGGMPSLSTLANMPSNPSMYSNPAVFAPWGGSIPG
jgi:hypothetical protein